MKFRELLEIVADEPVFETGLLRSGRGREAGLEAQLSRWCAGGRLLRLRRGLFALAPLAAGLKGVAPSCDEEHPPFVH